MTNYQYTDSKKRKGNEFLAIYGITLVAAFMLMSAFQFLVKGEPVLNTEELMETPLSTDSPIAGMEDVFPIRMLRKIFVNQSF